MNYIIKVDGCAAALEEEQLFFRGYICHAGKLLFDSEAAAVISSALSSAPPGQLFRNINGSFQFIYLQERILYFSIDHFGGHALFYRLCGDFLELFDNPPAQAQPGPLNEAAFASLLASGFTLAQDTLFREIQECHPGTLYSFSLATGGFNSRRWFGYHSTNEKPLEPAKVTQLLDDLFPVPQAGRYALSLSGGIDSRLLFGVLIKKELPFFTYSFGSEHNRDKQIAAQLASSFGIEHVAHDFTPETCRDLYNETDLDFILRNCTLGRSLPNETDLLSSRALDPGRDIIVKGFGGDWLSGRYITPALLKLQGEAEMTRYLFDKYFNLTCQSSPRFQRLLYSRLANLLQTTYYPYNPDPVASAEQWNQHHNERKYILNTLSFYQARGFRFYLPFYDRCLMQYFSRLRFGEKIDQTGYFIYLRKHYFLEELAPLRELPTLRGNFLAPYRISRKHRFRSTVHGLLRALDRAKIRKRFARADLNLYADTLMLFNHDFQLATYLKNPVQKNFPPIKEVAALLWDCGCPLSAAHLEWLGRQATSQLNVNGISICKFFFNPQFVSFLKRNKA